MIYPTFLQPTGTELFTVSDQAVQIPKCFITLEEWAGKPVNETFGGKPIVSFENEPMFAELAIMKHFAKAGWQARWIETYGRSNRDPMFLTEWKDDKYINQTPHPIDDKDILNLLTKLMMQNANSYSGCWDVLGWKDGRVIFAELKRMKQDRIRTTQIQWLASGLEQSLLPENFLVVQWSF